jgi:hypothetical protein
MMMVMRFRQSAALALSLAATAMLARPLGAQAPKMPPVPKKWVGVLWYASFKGSDADGGSVQRQLSPQGGMIPLTGTNWSCKYSKLEVKTEKPILSELGPTRTYESVTLECAYQDGTVQVTAMCARAKDTRDVKTLILDDKNGRNWAEIGCAYHLMTRVK